MCVLKTEETQLGQWQSETKMAVLKVSPTLLTGAMFFCATVVNILLFATRGVVISVPEGNVYLVSEI
jgi:hypothetical protein